MSRVCHYFNSSTGCWRGSDCRFRHDQTTVEKPCRFYGTARGCKFGDRCRYSHSNPTSNADTSSSGIGSVRSSPIAEALPNNTSAASACRVLDTNGDAGATALTKELNNLTISDRTVALYDPVVAAEGEAAMASGKWDIQRRREERNRKAAERNAVAKCSRCKVTFSSDPDPVNNYDALAAHYVDMFGKGDQKHLRYFSNQDELMDGMTICPVCDNIFERPIDFLRHVKDKSKGAKKKEDIEKHKNLLEEVVNPFVDNDLGLLSDEELLEELKELFMVDSDDDESEFGMGFPFGIGGIGLAYMMNKAMNGGGHDFMDSDSDDEGMMGFSSSEVDELLCQGVKPWDDDAASVLAVLNGYGAYY